MPQISYTTSQSELSTVSRQRADIVISRFGDKKAFLNTVNPKTQTAFAANPTMAVMGDYPTLIDLRLAYGKNFPAIWVVPQLDNLTNFTGAKNITEEQHEELARIIANEYAYLKVTELLLFFYRFKAGKYGRFYGSVDPMVITCALRQFVNERNEFIAQYDRQQQEIKDEEQRQAVQIIRRRHGI